MNGTVVTPDQVSVEFLSEVLHAAGHESVEVTHFDKVEIGTGQMGKCIRYQLAYGTSDPNCPQTLIGKFASDDPGSRMTGITTLNYVREVGFYNNIASKLTIPMPKCYYAAVEDEGVEHLLLLEDLAPAEQGDQIVGCSPELAESAAKQLVGLQGPTWCDASLRTANWLAREDLDAYHALAKEAYQTLIPGFVDRFSNALTKAHVELFEQLGSSSNFPVYLPNEEIFCLSHMDYRLDNFLINEQSSPARITVVDWEGVGVNQPLTDVAYLLGSSLLPDVRIAYEEKIVRAYYNVLVDFGITGFSWDECWSAYRRASLHGFIVMVIAGMLVVQTKRGDRMLHAMIQRHAQHAADLHASEFLT